MREEVIAEVKARADIGAVIGRYVPLRKQGRSLVGLCPFHSEKTPSFNVRPAEGFFKCFGCDAKGDVIAFLQAHLGVRFPDAVRQLAEEHGVSIDGEPARPPRRAAAAPAPTLKRVEPPPREPPPADEVEDVWRTCVDVWDDPQVASWLRDERGLDPARVTDRDLARALPVGRTLPRWARGRGPDGPAPWDQLGFRLVVPVYDDTGALRSLRARAIVSDAPRKETAPIGASAGLVMADAVGRLLLSQKSLADGVTAREHVVQATRRRGTEEELGVGVIIAEGVPAWLAWASWFSDADEDVPAVFGIYSGSWTSTHADRIPDGCRVRIDVDDDDAGEKYIETIKATFVGRRVDLTRFKVKP